MSIDWMQMQTAEARAAEAADARMATIKAECGSRILAVADANAQLNLAGAAAAGTLDAEQAAVYRAALDWIAAMRAACARIVTDPARDPADDASWPACPPEVRALAAAF